jgi:hypothetical protein
MGHVKGTDYLVGSTPQQTRHCSARKATHFRLMNLEVLNFLLMNFKVLNFRLMNFEDAVHCL